MKSQFATWLADDPYLLSDCATDYMRRMADIGEENAAVENLIRCAKIHSRLATREILALFLEENAEDSMLVLNARAAFEQGKKYVDEGDGSGEFV